MAEKSETGEPTEERLEELDEHIEEARRDSKDALHGSFYEGEESMFEQINDAGAGPEDGPETYADSGEESRDDSSDTGVDSKSDDQNIAP
jgi:hypothetical protein